MSRQIGIKNQKLKAMIQNLRHFGNFLLNKPLGVREENWSSDHCERDLCCVGQLLLVNPVKKQKFLCVDQTMTFHKVAAIFKRRNNAV